VYNLARRAGRRVPDDLSVVGYGDAPQMMELDPPLTTIRLPLEEMGRQAVRRLAEKTEELKKNLRTHYTMTFPGELVLRGSHRKIK
jgi:LacI family transcriptional regulator